MVINVYVCTLQVRAINPRQYTRPHTDRYPRTGLLPPQSAPAQGLDWLLVVQSPCLLPPVGHELVVELQG